MRVLALTDREFEALVAAMALYQAEFEHDGTRKDLRNIEIHDDIIKKWHKSGKR